MLFELYIENIAIIEKTTILFEKGFNVLTGETGAGKSILINSINAILGERVTKDIVRTGEKKAFVSAVFKDVSNNVINKLDELGYQIYDNEDLIISREISSSGGTVCRILGRPANVSVLRELGLSLINIHGQHNTQDLLSSEKHIDFITIYGDLHDEIENYIKEYSYLISIKRKLSEINIDEGEQARQVDVLTYQINEIEKADLSVEEEEQLLIEQKKIHNFAAISTALNEAYQSMYGDDIGDQQGALNNMSLAADKLEEATNLTGSDVDLAERFRSLFYEINDISINISSLLSEIDVSPEDVNNIEYRLDEIYHIKRKYGNSIEDVLEFLDEKIIELDELNSYEGNTKKLEKEIEKQEELTMKLAISLSSKRKVFGEKFCEKVGNELEYLDMPGVKITFSNKKTNLSKKGIDEIEFLIATNKGETPKPLAKIASGGELSRIMLSIKNVLANKDDVNTMIFDEIDTGVSGRAAQKVGNKLKETSKGRQVICVTHLAQIAALADSHKLIFKKTDNKRTFTEVKTLVWEDRKKEIARIIGGESITDITLKNAEEMLEMGKK